MRRPAVAVVLIALAGLLASLSGSPSAAVPSIAQPAAIAHPGGDDGNLYIAPEEYFVGDAVKLTANLPTEAALLDVTFYEETSPGSGDYDEFESDEANSKGNAYVSAHQVTEKVDIFARASNGMVTEVQTLDPKVVDPNSCSVTGNTYVSPTFITAGQEVKLTANFPSDQAGTTVTYFTKDGDTATSIGTDDANSSGNAYLYGYAVEQSQEVFAKTSKGECSSTIPLTVTTIDPANFEESGTLSTDPASIRDGRTATIIARFPAGSFNVTAFELKDGVWEAIGTDASNASGDGFITGHKFDNTETIMAVTDTGLRTPVKDIETIPPNVVSGGPDTLGKNVVYLTTDNGGTPKTKGVDYKGKAVLESSEGLTETLDVDEIAVRGNSSADYAKKPYKVKFEDKQKPFGMKSDRTWILLANYNDWTFIRSMFAWDLGKQFDGLQWTPRSTFAELFINGKYLGSYQMVESIKIDSNRVPISKTEGQVIEFDPHWKEDGVPGMVGRTGVNYAWKDPDEFKDGDEAEEGLTSEKIAKMKDKIKHFEYVLYGANNTKNWAKIDYENLAPEEDWTTYLDMNSAVDYYLTREFTKDNDADMYRSNYFYVNNVDKASPDKFYMGPIWDFDRSAGAHPPSDTNIHLPTGWWMRGNGSKNHDTNKIHWYTRITDDPRFLAAVKARWDEKRGVFEDAAINGVGSAVRKLGGTADDYELGKQVAQNDRERWAGYGGRYHAKTSSYTGELSWVRKWYQARFAWMDEQLTN